MRTVPVLSADGAGVEWLSYRNQASLVKYSTPAPGSLQLNDCTIVESHRGISIAQITRNRQLDGAVLRIEPHG